MDKKSDYSYYSLDDHHDEDSPRVKKTTTGMTEQNVIPDSLPAQINNLEDQKQADNQQRKATDEFLIEEDQDSNWSDQMREANEKSGFTSAKNNSNVQAPQKNIINLKPTTDQMVQ